MTAGSSGAVVIGPEVHGVLVEAVHERLGGGGEPGFRVSRRRGVVAIDVSEVPLPVHERVADDETLGEAHERVVDRLVAVGMEVPHDVAGDLGGFAERPCRAQLQLAHGEQDSAVDGLQPVAGVGQGAVHDRGKRVLQVPLLDRFLKRFGFRRRHVQMLSHALHYSGK